MRARSDDTRASRSRATRIAATLLLALLAIPLSASSATAKVPGDFFGISAEAPAAKDYRGMGKAGFGTYRAPINWKSAQKTRNGAYDWSQADQGISSTIENGMRPTVVVFGTPRFVHRPSSKGLYPPKGKSDLREWRQFTAALAARYGPDGEFFDATPGVAKLPVKRWILWNEQNAKSNWLPKASPRGYAKLVESGDRGISKVDPKARIVLGGMYGYPRDPKSMKAEKFLRKLYGVRGIKKHFDAVNAHPYGPGTASVKAQVKGLRSVARKAGDRRVGVVVGEFGWASKGPARSKSVVGNQGQAHRLRDTLRLLVKKRNAWNVEGAFIYVWRDFKAGQIGCLWCPGAGLVKQNGKPKPALKAVKRVIRRQR